MELLTIKNSWQEYTYFLDKNDRKIMHGEYKCWYDNGRLGQHLFYYRGYYHGELKFYDRYGDVMSHSFYIHGTRTHYKEMNDQEKLLFQIKYPGFRFIED